MSGTNQLIYQLYRSTETSHLKLAVGSRLYSSTWPHRTLGKRICV